MNRKLLIASLRFFQIIGYGHLMKDRINTYVIFNL